MNLTEVQHGVFGVSIASDGYKLLFIPAEGEGLRIYDANGELVSSFKAREKVLDVDNTPEGVYVIIGSDDLRVYLLENELIPEFTPATLTIVLIAVSVLAVALSKKFRNRRKGRLKGLHGSP